MYYEVSGHDIFVTFLPFLLPGIFIAPLIAYLAYRKWKSVRYVLPFIAVVAATYVLIYFSMATTSYSFFYNGTHFHLRLGDEVFDVDVRGCEKAWIEDAKVSRVYGLGTPGVVAGRLRVEGVGEGYGLVAHTRSVLYIKCNGTSYIIGAPGLTP